MERKIKNGALEIVAKLHGYTKEEAEKIILQQEIEMKEKVRLISAYELTTALRTAFVEVLDVQALVVGPPITAMVIHELFDKEEGEE